MNVDAVETAPPSRNQVTTEPNLRPPRPHSFSLARSPRRQRDARKPIAVTAPKSRMKMVRATPSTECFTARSPDLAEDDPGEQRRDRHPRELVPVEEREAEQLGLLVGVQRHPQEPDERRHEQQVPEPRRGGAAAPLAHLAALRTGVGHSSGFPRWLYPGTGVARRAARGRTGRCRATDRRRTRGGRAWSRWSSGPA